MTAAATADPRKSEAAADWRFVDRIRLSTTGEAERVH
jgi:hypothetical protein